MTTSPPASSQPLTRLGRAVACTVGAASGAAGAVSVFTTGNGTGSAALIGAGLLLSLIGATGRLPLRGSVAGNEYDLSSQVLDRAMDELPPEQSQQVAWIAVEEAAARSQPALQAAAGRRVWRTQAEEALHRAAAVLGATLQSREHRAGDEGRPDAVVSAGDRTVLVELRPRGVAAPSLQALLAALRQPTANVLVVTPADPARAGVKGMIVQWRSPEDDCGLVDALEAALHPE